jgi:hypothetical protein
MYSQQSYHIVLGGMIGTGKSTFAFSLERALSADPDVPSVGLHEIDPYSDTHAMIAGTKTPAERQKKAKVDFERVLVPRIVEFKEDTSAVVLGDLPGKLTNPRMGEMVAHASHAIVVGRHEMAKDACNPNHRSTDDWLAFFERRGIPVIAKVQSLLPGQEAWEGFLQIEGLSRVPLPNHPAVHEVKDTIKTLMGIGPQLRLVASAA